MRFYTVKEAARAVHRREETIRQAVNASPGCDRFLPSWRDPDCTQGTLIFEEDLAEWVRRNYVPATNRGA